MTGGEGASENTGGAAASIEHTGREKRAIYWIRRRLNGEKLNSQGAGLGQPLMDALRTLMRALRCVRNASHTSMQECLCAVKDCAIACSRTQNNRKGPRALQDVSGDVRKLRLRFGELDSFGAAAYP